MTTISVVSTPDVDDLTALRHALWPHGNIAEYRAEVVAALAAGKGLALIARDDHGRAVGFAEASIRHDYVNGCETSPVAFLEGIYVDPGHRRTGLARRLVEEVETWARQHGYRELASDATIDNGASHAMHNALGFTETRRVVFFRKVLD